MFFLHTLHARSDQLRCSTGFFKLMIGLLVCCSSTFLVSVLLWFRTGLHFFKVSELDCPDNIGEPIFVTVAYQIESSRQKKRLRICLNGVEGKTHRKIIKQLTKSKKIGTLVGNINLKHRIFGETVKKLVFENTLKKTMKNNEKHIKTQMFIVLLFLLGFARFLLVFASFCQFLLGFCQFLLGFCQMFRFLLVFVRFLLVFAGFLLVFVRFLLVFARFLLVFVRFCQVLLGFARFLEVFPPLVSPPAPAPR